MRVLVTGHNGYIGSVMVEVLQFAKCFRAFPDFTAEWNARRGAREVYDAVRQASLTLNDFQARKFIRLIQFKHLLERGLLDHTLRRRETNQATAING